MKKHIAYVATMMAVLLIWAACDRISDVKNNEDNSFEYVSFKNHGCQGWPGLDKALMTLPCLFGHRVAGDTLTLSIRYVAQCCPAFRDSVSLHDATVDISLADTSALQCDCICEFANDFTFLYPDAGDLRVRFGWIGAPFELDTLIRVP